MARESLLDSVPIPPGNIFRIQAELPPEEAAAEYEARLAPGRLPLQRGPLPP